MAYERRRRKSSQCRSNLNNCYQMRHLRGAGGAVAPPKEKEKKKEKKRKKDKKKEGNYE